MKKTQLLLLLFLPLISFGQKKSSWSKPNAQKINQSELIEERSKTSAFKVYNLDGTDLKEKLTTANPRFSKTAKNVIMAFPDASGEMENYTVFKQIP